MTAIRSKKPLKYNLIKPNEEAIIELKIIDVREFIEQEICVISVQDSIVNSDDTTTVLNIRSKQFTFAELDALEDILPTPNGTYMERRMQRFRDGLLFITQNDPHPIYFSEASDWEVIV